MVKCAKCGYEGEGDSCARCGVIFSRLRPGTPQGSARSAGPRRTAHRQPKPPSAPAFSFLNVIVLASVLVLVGAAAWHFVERASQRSTEQSPVATTPKLEGGSLTSSADVPIGGEITELSGGGAVLSMPGFAGGETTGDEIMMPPAGAKVSLPTLSVRTVTAADIQKVIDIAEQHPGDERFADFVAKAHLLLALRYFSEGRYRETLASASEAEAWGAEPRDVARLSARTYLELQDLSDALKWAQAALAFGPDPDMYSILGNVYYLREELDRAIEAWQHSLALRNDPTVRASLEKAIREEAIAENFDKQRLSHFIVKYEGETMEDTGRLVLGSLERSYGFLKSRLDFEPKEPVVVILYARRDYNELGGPKWSAGLFDGKVRVPVRGLQNLDRHVESTLRHELTHAFLYAQAGKNCPRWLQEGMAEYSEGTDASQYGKMLAQRIDQDGDFAYCLVGVRCDVRLYYPAATSVVDYIIKNRGMGGVKDILSLLGEGYNIDQALNEVVGRDEMGLMKEWQHFVKRRYL